MTRRNREHSRMLSSDGLLSFLFGRGSFLFLVPLAGGWLCTRLLQLVPRSIAIPGLATGILAATVLALAVSISLFLCISVSRIGKGKEAELHKPGNMLTVALAQMTVCCLLLAPGNLSATYYSDFGGKFGNIGLGFLNSSYLIGATILSALLLPKAWSSAIMRPYRGERTSIALLAIAPIAAFCSFGDGLFFHRAGGTPDLCAAIALFLLACWWVLPFEYVALFLMEKAATAFARQPLEREPSGNWLRSFTAIVAVWGIYLVGCNPANMSLDSFSMWQAATGTGKILDIGFPTFLILIWRLLLTAVRSPLFLVSIQILAMAAVAAAFFAMLGRHGLSRRTILVLAISFAALPQNGFMAVTLWSNVPYTCALLALTCLLLRILEDRREERPVPWAVFGLAFCIPPTYALRSTGFIPALLTLIVLIVLAVRTFRPRYAVAAATAIAGIMAILGPLNGAMVEKPRDPVSGSWLQPLDGIVGTAAFGGQLPDATKAYLEEFMSLDEWKANYRDYDTLFRGGPSPKSHKDGATISTGRLIVEYLRTFAANPALVMRNRLNKTDLLWDMTQPHEASIETIFPLLVSNDFGIQRRENILTRALVRYYDVFYYCAPLNMLTWRGGPYLLSSLILLVFLSAHGMRRISIAFLPAAGDFLALAMAMVWPATRYVWFMQVICPLLILYSLAVASEKARSRPAEIE